MTLLLHAQRDDSHLSISSLIEWAGLNVDDSHRSVSSKPLIENEEANQTVMAKC